MVSQIDFFDMISSHSPTLYLFGAVSKRLKSFAGSNRGKVASALQLCNRSELSSNDRNLSLAATEATM